MDSLAPGMPEVRPPDFSRVCRLLDSRLRLGAGGLRQTTRQGQGHHAALRAVAFKWIRIFHRCGRDRVPYSEQRYARALEARAEKAKPATVEIKWNNWRASPN
jgi:hypothetical protein